MIIAGTEPTPYANDLAVIQNARKEDHAAIRKAASNLLVSNDKALINVGRAALASLPPPSRWARALWHLAIAASLTFVAASIWALWP